LQPENQAVFCQRALIHSDSERLRYKIIHCASAILKTGFWWSSEILFQLANILLVPWYKE